MDSLPLALHLSRTATGLRRRLEVQGLSLHEYAVLSHLAQAPEHRLRRLDLADAVGLTTSGIARLLAPLERRGYVDRVPDPRDARRALVTLTPAGSARMAEAAAVVTERADDLLAGLSAEERVALGEALTRIDDRARARR